MRRLLQALRNNIYEGDIVTLKETGKLHFVKTIRPMWGRKKETIVLINSEGLSNHFTTFLLDKLTKERKLTFKNEWNRLTERGSVLNLKRLYTLEERCKNRNISYLYADLVASKTTEQFKFNMELINKMLDGDKQSGL